MSDIKWDVYILGESQLGVERSTLVSNLAATFKKDIPVIEKMLRKSRSLLKANVDLATAKKYKMAIDKAGGLCELIEHAEQLFPNDALSPAVARPLPAVTPLGVVPVEAAPTASASVHASTYTDHFSITYSSPYESPRAEVEQPSHFCFKCGAALHAGMIHCPKCRTEQPQFNSKNKVAAGALAFFVGGFGVHRFYLGQWWGVFYLLFWGTLIPSIISLLEAFVFWLTPKERWQRKYGQVPSPGPGMIVAIIIGAILFIAIIGILAAIALPAYQDYSIRSKVRASAALVDETRAKVEKVILEKNFFPSENVLAGLPENISTQHVRSIRLDQGAKLVVTYNAGNAPTIIWTPKKSGTQIVWDCKGGTMQDKQRDPECRGGVTTQRPESGKSASDIRMYSDDKKISLVVPRNWSGNRQLNEHALLGVANLATENYAIVMAEAKQDFNPPIDAAAYLGFVVKTLASSGSGLRELEPVKSVQINGRRAQQQEIAVVLDGVKIVYVLTVTETDSDFYITYAWTLESLYEKNRKLLRTVSESFTIHNSTTSLHK
ncbi:NINE protein [Cellvibrio mixtus]|uniref:NINE protein n=1 Tax=Cellvibrio mixtus TaxID=39650 RepID=UPI00069491BF|nr:NINE protein [Cellvibrio mixtus]